MDIGIDLGTTFSVIAVKGKVDLAPGFSGAEYLDEVGVTILPSESGDTTIPSVLWWHPDDPDRYLFGEAAKQMAEEGKSPIMFSKRSIGTTDQLMLNGRVFTAKEVAERFLRYMKQWAETVTGQKVDRAVVTHPAYFSPSQRDETLKAAQGAGLNITPEQLMMEPCAAAMAYTVNDARDPLRVMSYDLGGGTFDVAVMEKIQGVVQVKKFHGDHLLGGYNFDRALVQWMLDQIKAKSKKTIPYDESNEEHRGRRARMLQVAEAVKIRLGEQKTDKVNVPVQVDFLLDDQGNKVQFRDQINREQYAALISEELQQTIQCCHSALEGANMKPEDLHAILLVGGSTKGKWVVDAVAKAFAAAGEPYYPDLCVAAGAALCAAQLPPLPEGNELLILTLNYQAKSVLSRVNIAGSIVPTPGSELTLDGVRRLQVYLQPPVGPRLGPAELGSAGQFLFKQVVLLDDGSPSPFTVSVSDNGKILYSQSETIVYVDEGPPPPPPVPVLPRPLFVKAERMVPLAEEGAALPAKCQVKLRRVFGGATEKIEIFLETESMGEILIEDIPDEAGEGCMVLVDVEVTQSNEMRGKVLVYGPNGKTVMREGPVRIAFPPVVIPELSVLLGQFDELRDQLENNLATATQQDRARLAGPGRALIRRIKKMTDEQAPDRQLLFERIKELRRIVHPPTDDMDPPGKDFDSLLAECRDLTQGNAGLQSYISQIDRVETAGKDAYATKNNRKWTTANETLSRIHANMQKAVRPPPDKQDTPETNVLKHMASRQIDQLRSALRTARDTHVRLGDADRWQEPCDQCARTIDAMAAKVAGISDNTPKEQAMAQVQSFLQPSADLEKKIARIQAGTRTESF